MSLIPKDLQRFSIDGPNVTPSYIKPTPAVSRLVEQILDCFRFGVDDTYGNLQDALESIALASQRHRLIHGIRPAELIEEQKKGRKVFGTFCVYVPDEVVIAADGIVTGLCGGSQFWVPGGEQVLPKSTCPLIKASVGARLGRTCPFFRIADMYVGETTCDGKKKAWEILGKDVPMYIMDMPQMKREKDIEKWYEEIKDFAGVVEKFTGNAITPEKLKEAIHIVNEKRRALARVYEARKADCIPISGKDALLMMQIVHLHTISHFMVVGTSSLLLSFMTLCLRNQVLILTDVITSTSQGTTRTSGTIVLASTSLQDGHTPAYHILMRLQTIRAKSPRTTFA